MSKLSQWAGLGNNPVYDFEGEIKHRRELLKRLSKPSQFLLDNHRDMHFGIGLPEPIVRFGS